MKLFDILKFLFIFFVSISILATLPTQNWELLAWKIIAFSSGLLFFWMRDEAAKLSEVNNISVGILNKMNSQLKELIREFPQMPTISGLEKKRSKKQAIRS